MAGNRSDNTTNETTTHNWRRVSFAPMTLKGRMYIRLECDNCGAKAKRFGNDIELDVRSLRDPLMRACVKRENVK